MHSNTLWGILTFKILDKGHALLFKVLQKCTHWFFTGTSLILCFASSLKETLFLEAMWLLSICSQLLADLVCAPSWRWNPAINSFLLDRHNWSRHKWECFHTKPQWISNVTFGLTGLNLEAGIPPFYSFTLFILESSAAHIFFLEKNLSYLSAKVPKSWPQNPLWTKEGQK